MIGISAIGCCKPPKKENVVRSNTSKVNYKQTLSNDVFEKQNTVRFGSQIDSEIYRRLKKSLTKKDFKKAWKNYKDTQKASEHAEATGRLTKEEMERLKHLRGQSIATVVRAIEYEVKGI